MHIAHSISFVCEVTILAVIAISAAEEGNMSMPYICLSAITTAFMFCTSMIGFDKLANWVLRTPLCRISKVVPSESSCQHGREASFPPAVGKPEAALLAH